MILIPKTADCLLGGYVIAYSVVLKVIGEFVRMREITRSVKGALNVLLQSLSPSSIYRIGLPNLSM